VEEKRPKAEKNEDGGGAGLGNSKAVRRRIQIANVIEYAMMAGPYVAGKTRPAKQKTMRPAASGRNILLKKKKGNPGRTPYTIGPAARQTSNTKAGGREFAAKSQSGEGNETLGRGA